MEPFFARQLDALAGWRRALDRQLADFAHFLAEHDLLDPLAAEACQGVRQRLADDRLVVAFVAEFSRGKSELINAIFFGDTGRRILPATPGRTTMCPVELGWRPGEPALLSLLPIQTRLEAASLAEWRERPEAWTRVRLDAASPERLAESLTEVMRTQAVSVAQARALGLWRDDAPDDNPALIAEDLVEVPAWRHASINYPHPLLRRGLVVLDTPGLNAVGAEPELTLSLLPAAHALVFVLGADTGVTRSDLSMWQDHLSNQTTTRFVVLNKIDTLADPLLSPDAVQAQVERQRDDCARLLDVSVDRVFALSARQALAARVSGHRAGVVASGLPAFEEALTQQLLPQRRDVLAQSVVDATASLHQAARQRLADARRQTGEQLAELHGLRGKSTARVQWMLARVDAETADFERCLTRLAALRSIHARALHDTVAGLASDTLRSEVARMQRDIAASLFHLGARKAFVALCARLRTQLVHAQSRGEETREMLAASYDRLNVEFGFTLTLPPAPGVERWVHELDRIERSYSHYLGLSHALKLSEPRFMEQFRRMLLSKLRITFESAVGEIELWNKAASAQVDAQLRERRRGFKRRREALERIRQAAEVLEQRIAELQAQDQHARQLVARSQVLSDALGAAAHRPPDLGEAPPPTAAEREPPTLTLVVPRAAMNAA